MDGQRRIKANVPIYLSICGSIDDRLAGISIYTQQWLAWLVDSVDSMADDGGGCGVPMLYIHNIISTCLRWLASSSNNNNNTQNIIAQVESIGRIKIAFSQYFTNKSSFRFLWLLVWRLIKTPPSVLKTLSGSEFVVFSSSVQTP